MNPLLALSTALGVLASPPALQRQTLTILYSANTKAEMKSCGCGEGMLGGLARRATLIRGERAQGGPVLLLDAGNTFFIASELPKYLLAGESGKASRIASVYRQLGYDAILEGENDALLTEKDRKKLPFLTVGGASILVERGGWRVAIFGYRSPMLGPEGTEGGTEGRRRTEPEHAKLVQEATARLQNSVKERGQGADLVILLIEAPEKERNGVVGELKGVDLAIAGYTEQLLWEPVKVGGALIFEAGERGQYLGRIRIQKKASANGGTEPLSTSNQAQRLRMQKELEFVGGELQGYREGTKTKPAPAEGIPAFAMEFEQMEHKEAELEKKLSLLHGIPSDWYAADILPVSESLLEDPVVNELLK